MEYYNMIIFILVFLILIATFYLIVNNIGTNTSEIVLNDTILNDNTKKDLENKIYSLKYELNQIKNEINTQINTQTETISIPLKNKDNVIKEIIIEQDTPDINPINSNTDNNTNTDNDNNNKIPFNKPPPIIFDPIAKYDMAKLTDPLVDPRGRSSADQIPTPQVAMQFNFPTQGVLDKYHRIGLLIAIDDNHHAHKKNKIKRFELPDSDSESIKANEFKWNGPSKTNINKRKKRFIKMNNSEKTYKGVEIKENFDNYSDDSDNSDSVDDSDSFDDSESIENFGNINKSTTNVYNVYTNNSDNNILELIGKKITNNWYKYFTSITMGNKIIKVVVRNKNRKELYCGDIVYIPELGRSYKVKIDPMDMIEYNPYLF